MTTNVEPECNIPILYLACCVEVIGQGLASIPQTNF